MKDDIQDSAGPLQTALHNIQFTCTSFSKTVIKIYCSPSTLIILGSAEIQLTKGTTQDDNLAMSSYALTAVEI